MNNLHICDTCIKILKYELNNGLKIVCVVSWFDDLAEIAIGDWCEPDFAFQIIFFNLNTPWGFSWITSDTLEDVLQDICSSEEYFSICNISE